MADLLAIYAAYLDCLNRQDWANLGQFVAQDARHNGRDFGLTGYRAMLQADFRAIPDLQFRSDFVIAQPPRLAARLLFDCRPMGVLFGLPVGGQRVQFSENVFYRFENGQIAEVHSLIDRDAIAQQIAQPQA